MKTIEEIYLDEVHEIHMRLGEKTAKLFMAEPVRKFVLNCLLKNEQLHKHDVGGGLLPKCPNCHGTGIDPTIPNLTPTQNSKPEQLGNEAQAQSGRVGCVHNTLKYIGPWYSCEQCGTHFNARAEVPSEGALPF